MEKTNTVYGLVSVDSLRDERISGLGQYFRNKEVPCGFELREDGTCAVLIRGTREDLLAACEEFGLELTLSEKADVFSNLSGKTDAPFLPSAFRRMERVAHLEDL